MIDNGYHECGEHVEGLGAQGHHLHLVTAQSSHDQVGNRPHSSIYLNAFINGGGIDRIRLVLVNEVHELQLYALALLGAPAEHHLDDREDQLLDVLVPEELVGLEHPQARLDVVLEELVVDGSLVKEGAELDDLQGLMEALDAPDLLFDEVVDVQVLLIFFGPFLLFLVVVGGGRAALLVVDRVLQLVLDVVPDLPDARVVQVVEYQEHDHFELGP